VNAEVDGKISVIFDGVFAGWDENRERSELSFWLFSFDLSLLILFAFWDVLRFAYVVQQREGQQIVGGRMEKQEDRGDPAARKTSFQSDFICEFGDCTYLPRHRYND
jgi:hypothetical protein